MSIRSDMAAQFSDAEIREQLAFEIADEMATSMIEGNCAPCGGGWWLAGEIVLEESPFLTKCVRYLELRGLIEQHPQQPDWIRSTHESREI